MVGVVAGYRGVIGDSRYVLLRVGHGDASQTDPLDNAPSGLTVDQRLALCREFVASDPPVGELSVWLAYGNARLETHAVEIGPVAFFASYLFDEHGQPDPARWGNAPVPIPDLGDFMYFQDRFPKTRFLHGV